MSEKPVARGNEDEKEKKPRKLEPISIFKQTEWVAAHARLLTLLPAARETMPTPCMSPDKVLKAAKSMGYAVEEDIIYNPWRGAAKGRGNKRWENYDNLELFDLMFEFRNPTPGPLWFAQGLPQQILGENLRLFVADAHCDLQDDALFIWCEVPQISVIHHAGAFFHISAPK